MRFGGQPPHAFDCILFHLHSTAWRGVESGLWLSGGDWREI
jgi:hypothetical protein